MPNHNGDDGGEMVEWGSSSTDGGESERAGAERSVPDERTGPDEPVIDGDVLELDHVFEVLDHPRRRYLLYTLSKDDQWSLTELATEVAAWETGTEGERVDGTTRDRVYVSLYHAHVPKLVDEDVVRFDEEAETIARGPNADQVLAVLEGAGASLDSRQEEHAGREHEGDDE